MSAFLNIANESPLYDWMMMCNLHKKNEYSFLHKCYNVEFQSSYLSKLTDLEFGDWPACHK